MRSPLFAILMLTPVVLHAAECTVRSGPQVNAVVELYTSEGCSSCPPADRWLSGLAPAAASGRVVPLGFHVNYWDYIGWKDAFASGRATERQRERAGAAGARSVYTPQVVVGGRDFRGWRGGGERAIEEIQRKPARVSIELAIKSDAASGIEVASTATVGSPGLRADDLVVLVAATQNRLASRVTAGENRGERLAHDFVVRDFAVHRGIGRASSVFRPSPNWNLANMSVAAFVQDARTGEILQAVSTPACR
jgi:hypothetical protein